ncbi:MAG: AraC family transcriptional regulator [Candidatus Cloacimonetes bacterium]|nr:AraC family transcriptional regulator [Candidatus Cloacimonadota bacterium]
MDYRRSIQSTLNLMEDRLTRQISTDELADRAGFSMYHFHRVFRYHTGHTPKAYLRLRRLSEAAKEVTFTANSLKSIAARYGYESQQVFTRIFKSTFGITPGRMRKTKQAFHYLRPVRLVERATRGEEMKPDIIEKAGMKLIGMRTTTTTGENEIPQLWKRFMSRLKEIENATENDIMVGVCPYENMDIGDYTPETPFDYLACVLVESSQNIPDGMEFIEIPPAKYARFIHKGALDTLVKTYEAIYSGWVNDTEHKLAETDQIEWYDNRFEFGQPDSEMDILIPIQ